MTAARVLENEGFVFSAQQTRPPDKPPDAGLPTSGKSKPTFRDMVFGNKNTAPGREEIDLVKKGLAKLVLLEGNRLLPSVEFDDAVIREYSQPWKDVLIVTLLGKRLGYRIMKEKLKAMWRLQHDFELMDIDNGYFMVKFDHDTDRQKVMEGGPWMVFDHYLALTHWTPEFDSTTASISKTLVWVRFSGLNHVFYEKNLLFPIASLVGKPIKLDVNTETVGRGKFARVCVEIDLKQPVVGKVCVQGHWHKVEYEGLHVICSNCGCYGHVTRNCSFPSPVLPKPTTENSQQPSTSADGSGATSKSDSTPQNMEESNSNNAGAGEVYGDWLTVTRKKKIGWINGATKNGNKSHGRLSQQKDNRFASLVHDHEESNIATAGNLNHQEVDHGKELEGNVRNWAKNKRMRSERTTNMSTPVETLFKNAAKTKDGSGAINTHVMHDFSRAHGDFSHQRGSGEGVTMEKEGVLMEGRQANNGKRFTHPFMQHLNDDPMLLQLSHDPGPSSSLSAMVLDQTGGAAQHARESGADHSDDSALKSNAYDDSGEGDLGQEMLDKIT